MESSSISWLRGRIWSLFISRPSNLLWRLVNKFRVFQSHLANTRFVSYCLHKLGRPPRWPLLEFPTSGFEVVPESTRVEEENFPHFQTYYPVRIGEVFNNGRYQVVGKLGFGVSATVWLATDRIEYGYVVLKIFIRDADDADREISVSHRLRSGDLVNIGHAHTRMPLHSFDIPRKGGDHRCLVLEPLGSSLEDIRLQSREGRLHPSLVQNGIKQVLRSLVYLHHECQIVHSDIKSDHIMQEIRDPSDFENFVQAEFDDPAIRKFVNGNPIYSSRHFGHMSSWGYAKLCDFGNAHLGNDLKLKMAQPEVYRAPELLLMIPWSFPIDIWNVGLLAWNMIQGEPLFLAREEPFYNDEAHMLEMISVLGPPPANLIFRGNYSHFFFDDDGNCTIEKGPGFKERNLEDELTILEGEDKRLFLDFIRKTLTWDPNKRASLAQLLNDPWIDGYTDGPEPYMTIPR